MKEYIPSLEINRNKRIRQKKIAHVAILGNPNSGKTALFNRLTGLHQKTGNFPGVTVEKKKGWLKKDDILIEDLPGSYSLKAQSLDEKIVSDYVHSWRITKNRPDAVIVVIDATNLSRNIFFALQILDWNLPTIIVLNMIDEVREKKIHIDINHLENRLNAIAIIPASAKSGEGIDTIISAIKSAVKEKDMLKANSVLLKLDDRHVPLQDLIDCLSDSCQDNHILPLIDSIRLVADDSYIRYVSPFLDLDQINEIKRLILKTRGTFQVHGISLATLESTARYAFIDQDLLQNDRISDESHKSTSEKIDEILTHPVKGSLIFVLLLGLVFNAIFSWAQYPMEMIQNAVTDLAAFVHNHLPASTLRSLLADGIIGGVGNVIVFMPQIILLVFFIGLMEDSGYMARISFMMDGLMGRFGLSGKAVLPMLSGFACAIPAVLAARTIEGWRSRLIVIMLIPLMSCSARLPVYTLLISAFIPQQILFGFIQIQGLVLLGIYFLGFVTALLIALIIKIISKNKKRIQYLIELPSYRWPIVASLWWRIFESGKKFIVNAGSIILAMTIILWFLASYPKTEKRQERTASTRVSQSYIGQWGQAIEPYIRPLGFDWKIGVGIITSFAAREVIISTFSTIYNIEAANSEESVALIQAMQDDYRPNGSRVFTPLVGISLLVFFVYAAQCMSTFAVIRRETKSWIWPILMLLYMNSLAYLAALIVFQGGRMIGWS